MSDFKQLLTKWGLSHYITKFEDEGWDDVDSWNDLIADNGKILAQDLIDKKGHRSKFIRNYNKMKNENAEDEKKEEEKIPDKEPMGKLFVDPKTNKTVPGFYVIPSTISCSDPNGNRSHYKNFQTKQMILSGKRNKVLLVVGQTGAGKSTVLNSMVNYIYGLEYAHNFRYKLIVEKPKKGGQAVSQTDHVSSYELPLKGSILDYAITVVDTPGFGDTRGVQHDIKIMKDIKLWFETKLDSLDAVCFVIKSTDSRLTPTQKYIFQSILNLFGDNIKNNIFALITFADTSDPPALAALAEDKVPYTVYYKLNNSVFFKDPINKGAKNNQIFDKLYWDMGSACFKLLFDGLRKTSPVSLTLSRQVLKEREVISTKIELLNMQLATALKKVEELEKQKIWIKTHQDELNANQEEPYFEKQFYWDDVKTGNSLVTTCKTCPNQTCHKNCGVSNNSRCWAMTKGKCRICGCPDWGHENRDYVWQLKSKQVRKTKWDDAPDMEKRYNTAKQEKSRSEYILHNLDHSLKRTEIHVSQCIITVKHSINSLSKIALNKNVLSTKDYIEKIIETETREKKQGWQVRVNSLKKLGQETEVVAKIQTNQFSFKKLIGWKSW